MVPGGGNKTHVLAGFGQFAGLLSYFSIPDFKRIVYAMAVSGLILLGARFFLPQELFAPPRGVVLMDFVISIGALTALRLASAWFGRGPCMETIPRHVGVWRSWAATSGRNCLGTWLEARSWASAHGVLR